VKSISTNGIYISERRLRPLMGTLCSIEVRGPADSIQAAVSQAFAAMVQKQKRDHFFTQGILDLARDGRLSVTKNPASVHNGATVRRESAFPDLGNLQLDLCENAAGGVALAAFAQHGGPHDEGGFFGQLLDRKRCELNGAQ